jgi:ribonuclease J
VELCPVDHSLPGACAYIIYPEGARNLVYTGDIRFHGYRGELSKKFIEKAKASNPKWLLCEGTRIDKEESDDERKVKNTISNLISKTKGLVFVEHPIRDLDRVKTIFEAAKENNRNLVVSTKLAYLIKIMGDLSPLPLESLKIFIQRKGWGLLYKEGFDTYQIETDYNQTKWEIEFLDGNNATKITEIARNPTKYVVSMNLWEIGNLIDLKPENAVWIKSSCEPFTDDMKVDDKRKKEWLNHFGIRYYPKEDEVETHASGHASGPEIREMIKKIGAEEVIPIHTEHPEFFKQD